LQAAWAAAILTRGFTQTPKAGNLNHALPQLQADRSRWFRMPTVVHCSRNSAAQRKACQSDPRVGFVPTPQHLHECRSGWLETCDSSRWLDAGEGELSTAGRAHRQALGAVPCAGHLLLMRRSACWQVGGIEPALVGGIWHRHRLPPPAPQSLISMKKLKRWPLPTFDRGQWPRQARRWPSGTLSDLRHRANALRIQGLSLWQRIVLSRRNPATGSSVIPHCCCC